MTILPTYIRILFNNYDFIAYKKYITLSEQFQNSIEKS
jgi:hypothetical protein